MSKVGFAVRMGLWLSDKLPTLAYESLMAAGGQYACDGIGRFAEQWGCPSYWRLDMRSVSEGYALQAEWRLRLQSGEHSFEVGWPVMGMQRKPRPSPAEVLDGECVKVLEGGEARLLGEGEK